MRDSVSSTSGREKWLIILIGLAFSLILARLFYWQVIRADDLQLAVLNQTQRKLSKVGERGQIFFQDGSLLVGNQPYYRLMVDKNLLELPKLNLVEQLVPLLLTETPAYLLATSSATQTESTTQLAETLTTILEKPAQTVTLRAKISPELKTKIENLHLRGLKFDSFIGRYYPEASMAAHVAGFVGKDQDGEDQGYFGVEGALDIELAGKAESRTVLTDALGKILPGEKLNFDRPSNGRDVTLTLRRDLQQLAEEALDQGIKKYGAKSGEIIMMDPATGKILALATWPSYIPNYYYWYDSHLYKNPSVVDLYEPGSTFKTLTVAAALDSQVITPETICTLCSGPRTIGKYTLKTWNEEYHPNISMTQALEKSDNVAMIFVSDLLGKDRQVDYMKKFGIGKPLQIDLQEDTSTPFPTQFGPVELATTSFGQGISTTSLQLMRAVGAIANHGQMMRPQIVEKVVDTNRNQEIVIQPVMEQQVITPQAAANATTMMISAALHGEAQWAVSKRYTIAGKTGTSQIPGPGGYQADKTIASFIGFAPPNEPKILMLVKLTEPSSSPWAAETAAPLWMKLAEKAFILLGIPADK